MIPGEMASLNCQQLFLTNSFGLTHMQTESDNMLSDPKPNEATLQSCYMSAMSTNSQCVSLQRTKSFNQA